MATTISTQDLIDVKRDIDDIGKAVNEKVIVSPRYGDDFKSLPMIAEEFQISSDAAEAAATIAQDSAAIAQINANIAEAAATAATISAGVFDTPEAGVDPVTGVADGEYYNVRSPSNESYIDEYQNVGGSAVATGKSYPSSAAKWDASLVIDEDKNQKQINSSTISKIPSIKDYGAKYNGTSDLSSLTSAQNAHKEVIINDGETYIPIFVNNGRTLRGNGKPVVNVDPNGVGSNPVCVQFKTGSITENVTFQSTAENKEWQRSEIQSNSILRNVGLYGFRHLTGGPNAWGLYLADCSNVLIDTCHFGQNSQADIALVDNVRNVTVIQPRNADGVIFNIEPNGNDIVDGVNVIGGEYKTFYCLENTNTAKPVKNVFVSGASISGFVYRGGGITLSSCTIKTFKSISGHIHCGQLKIDNASLGLNLLTDPYVSDISNGGNSFWTFYSATGGTIYDRVHDAVDGSYTRLNPNKTNIVDIRSPRFAVTAGEALVINICRKAVNAAGRIEWNAGRFEFYNASGTIFSTREISANAGELGSDLGFLNEVGIVVVPDGAVEVRLALEVQNTDCSVFIRKVGLYRINLNTSSGNFNSVIESNGVPVFTKTYKRNALPTGFNLSTYLQGDIVEINNPPLGTTSEYLVETSGTWATLPKFTAIKVRTKAIQINPALTETVITANSSSAEVIASMSGVVRGDAVVGAYVGDLRGCYLVVSVADTNYIKYRIVNPTAASVTIPAGDLKFKTI